MSRYAHAHPEQFVGKWYGERLHDDPPARETWECPGCGEWVGDGDPCVEEGCDG